MENTIIVDDILAKHYKQNKVFLTSNERETAKDAIKEIVEAVLEQAAENAKIKDIYAPRCDDHTPYWGACVTCGSISNPDILVGSQIDKSSILDTKEQIKY